MPCPMSIINYNANMGGVDLADQQRSYNGVGRESKKFWTYLAWYIINTSIVNSFIIIMKSLPLTHEQHNMTHLKYRMKIVSQLVGGFSSRKRAGRRGVEAPVIEPSHLPGHDLVKMSKKLVCRNCSQLGRKTPQGRGVSTTWSFHYVELSHLQGRSVQRWLPGRVPYKALSVDRICAEHNVNCNAWHKQHL